MTVSAASSSSFGSELAALLIQNEATQSEAAHADRDVARSRYLADANAQIGKLHEAAAATEQGALASAALAVAGGLVQMGAAGAQYTYDTDKAGVCERSASTEIKDRLASEALNATTSQIAGKMLGDCAAPVKAFLGDAAAARDQADAKTYETLGEQAKWQASDAGTTIDKTDRVGDRILDLVQSLQHDQSSANNAVIGRI